MIWWVFLALSRWKKFQFSLNFLSLRSSTSFVNVWALKLRSFMALGWWMMDASLKFDIHMDWSDVSESYYQSQSAERVEFGGFLWLLNEQPGFGVFGGWWLYQTREFGWQPPTSQHAADSEVATRTSTSRTSSNSRCDSESFQMVFHRFGGGFWKYFWKFLTPKIWRRMNLFWLSIIFNWVGSTTN